ncbi:MAG TPA: hypothetical protein VGL77_15265 [Armatimonadota bacterium]
MQDRRATAGARYTEERDGGGLFPGERRSTGDSPVPGTSNSADLVHVPGAFSPDGHWARGQSHTLFAGIVSRL